jgi:hypothetical protein
VKDARAFLVLAALPLAALGVLAALGARAHVGVVTTGAGPHVLLGGAWVAAWLASLTVTPIALVAAACRALLARWLRPKPSLRQT